MLKFLKHMPALRAMGKYSKISMQDYLAFRQRVKHWT
jgi:hypothetical protein